MEIGSEWSLVVLYQLLVTGSWSIVFVFVYPEISISSTVSSWPHKAIGGLVLLACIESWRRVFHSSPGYITQKTLHLYDHYPYDNVLFFPDAICPTLGIRKLARSKFDQYYIAKSPLDKGRHIPRFDHYCGWVKNSIGEQNYRDFLIFIMIHFGMVGIQSSIQYTLYFLPSLAQILPSCEFPLLIKCLYGSIIVFKLLQGITDKMNLFQATFVNAVTGEEVDEIDLFLVGQYLTSEYFPLVSLGVLLTGMSILLGIFVIFHLYITSRGMTTNEFYKWREVRRIYRSHPQRPKNFPTNIYNRGIRENFKDVLCPKSLYLLNSKG
jgi:palmitoyltransferase